MPSVNNTLIGAIRAEATLESGKFVEGAKKIQVESKKTEAQVKQSFGSMGSSVKGFGTALTAGLSIGLLGGVIKKSLDFATSIKDVAKQVGVTTKELQEFRYAASQVGITQAEADKGLEKLSLTLGKAASGSKTAKAALAAVGVTMTDVNTKSKPEIFGKIADTMLKQGGAARNAAAANAVFGESAAKLNPLLDRGSAGINELAAAANRLGVVLSDSQIQNADDTARKLDDVKRVLAAQIAGVVTDNATSIISLADALGKLTGAVVNFLNSNPTAALAIIGAMAGGRIGGLPGAAAGAIAGAGIGVYNFDPTKPLKPDQAFLKSRFIQEAGVLKQMRASGQPFGDQQAKVRRLRDRFLASGGAIPGSTQNQFALPQFLATGGGGHHRTRKGPRDRSDDVAFQFDQELRRAQVDTLRAQQSLAHTADDRAAIALKLLDAERQMQEAELQDRVRRAERDFAEGKITAGTLDEVKAQAEKLKAEYDAADALQRQAIADDLAAQKAQDAAQLVDSSYDLRLEQLQNEASLAETASERREVELRILDLMKEQERARLEAVLADTQASELAKAQAQQRLDSLDGIYAGRAAGVVQGTRGPMEDWLAQLPTTAAKAQEAFERLEVQGFDGLIDAALALSDGFDSAKDALLNTLKQFLLGLARMQLQQFAGSIVGGGGGGLGKFLGGLFGGGSTGGAMSDVGFGFASQGSLVGLPQFAGGGGFRVRGIPGIDRNTLSINGIPVANVSYGERLNVSNDNGGRHHGRSGDTIVNVNGVRDFDSFRRNERQVGRSTRRALGINQ